MPVQGISAIQHRYGVSPKRADMPGVGSRGTAVDMFVRQPVTSLRFGSASPTLPTFEEFDTWIRTQTPDTAKLGPWLTTVMTKSNRLGEGGEARGYEIPDQNRFALRCPTAKADAIEKGSVLRKAALVRADDPFPHLNVGQMVATIGPVQVVKRQIGYSMSMPALGDPAKYQALALTKARRVDALPPSAFNELAALREYLRQQDYMADADRDNVLISQDGQHFLQMDVVKNRTTKPFPPMNIASLLQTCLYGVPPQCREDAEVQKELEATNRRILDKCISAAKHAGFVSLPRNRAVESIIGRNLKACGLPRDADIDWFYAQL